MFYELYLLNMAQGVGTYNDLNKFSLKGFPQLIHLY
jgi:hypothetical protein